MNDPLAFLPSLALLVDVVARRVLEDLFVDALFFFGDFELDFDLDGAGLAFRSSRDLLRHHGRHDAYARSNDRATHARLRSLTRSRRTISALTRVGPFHEPRGSS